jgi:hypothetical protein
VGDLGARRWGWGLGCAVGDGQHAIWGRGGAFHAHSSGELRAVPVSGSVFRVYEWWVGGERGGISDARTAGVGSLLACVFVQCVMFARDASFACALRPKCPGFLVREKAARRGTRW